MDILVSAVASKLVFVEGSSVTYCEADSPDRLYNAGVEEISHILADAYDIEYLPNSSIEVAYGNLIAQWSRDRALRQLQILLDPDDDDDIRSEAAENLNALISSGEVRTLVSNFVYAIKAPEHVDWQGAQKLAKNRHPLDDFLSNLFTRQSTIGAARQMWEQISRENFDTELDKASFELVAVQRGVFRIMIEAPAEGKSVAMLDCLKLLSDVPYSRKVVMAWAKAIGATPKKKAVERVEETEEVNRFRYRSENPEVAKQKNIFYNVNKQKDGIRQRLKAGDEVHARRYAEELVRHQLVNGGAGFASKSLCDLAGDAEKNGLNDLRLAWLQEAVRLSPGDNWARAQAGDAYLDARRFEEAIAEYEIAAKSGTETYIIYAANGRGRALRALGRMQEASAAFATSIEKFGSVPDNLTAWASYAEVFRDMSRFEDALVAFERAYEHYPSESVTWVGRAVTLKDLGRLDEAYKLYSETIERFPDVATAYSGRADVLKLLGKLPDALAEYQAAHARFPNENVPLCGIADIYGEMGDYSSGLAAYAKAKQAFPREPSAYGGYAELLRYSGRLDEAIRAYDKAIELFPADVRSRNGRANVLKIAGHFKEALQAYDQNVADFPYDLYALSGRADLLRRLGHATDAIKAYDQIIKLRPDHPGAKPAKAAVLLTLARYEEAASLLTVGVPGTLTEWMEYHVKGMLLLRQGDVSSALKIFEYGISHSPFYKNQRFFKSGAAICHLRLGRFAQAAHDVQNPYGDADGLLKAHIYFEMDDVSRALSYLKAVNDNLPPPLAELKRELLAQFQNTTRPLHNRAWLIERETDGLLQAA